MSLFLHLGSSVPSHRAGGRADTGAVNTPAVGLPRPAPRPRLGAVDTRQRPCPVTSITALPQFPHLHTGGPPGRTARGLTACCCSRSPWQALLPPGALRVCPGPVCPPRLSGERLGCSHLLPACPPPLGRRGRMLGLGRALAPRVGTVPAAPQGSGQTGTSHCLSWVRAPGHHPASPAHSSLSFSLCGTGFSHGWPLSSPCWQARGSPQGRLPGALSTHPLIDRVVPAGQLVPLGARLGQ